MVILIIGFQILRFFVRHMEFAQGKTLSQLHINQCMSMAEKLYGSTFMRYVIFLRPVKNGKVLYRKGAKYRALAF